MKSNKQPTCSFCGKPESKDRRLLFGPGLETAICEECVTFSETILQEQIPAEPADGTCSFCGKSSSQVERLVFGPQSTICNNCIDFARQQLDSDSPPNAPALARPWHRWADRLRSLLNHRCSQRATTAEL
jgi:ATP-dependent protease Clp ATPase subunit